MAVSAFSGVDRPQLRFPFAAKSNPDTTGQSTAHKFVLGFLLFVA
jgi:hypothetical protein